MINGKSLTFAFILSLFAFIPLNAAENSVRERSVEDAELAFGKSAVDRFEQMFQSGDFDFKKYGYSDVEVLYYAVFMNDLERVKLLIGKGADVNAKGRDATPLIVAADNNNFEIVKIIVENGADVNAKNVDGFTVLFSAARNGNLEMVQYLVNQGISVSDSVGALHGAVASGNLELVQWLIAHGVDVNSYFHNDTVLAYALECKSRDVLRFLVEQIGVDVNASIHKKIYYPALECAVKRNNFETVKYLVEHGAKITPPYILGKFPTPGWYFLCNADPKIVQYLRERDIILKRLSIAVPLIFLAALMAFLYFVYRMVRPKKPAETKVLSS